MFVYLNFDIIEQARIYYYLGMTRHMVISYNVHIHNVFRTHRPPDDLASRKLLLTKYSVWNSTGCPFSPKNEILSAPSLVTTLSGVSVQYATKTTSKTENLRGRRRYLRCYRVRCSPFERDVYFL